MTVRVLIAEDDPELRGLFKSHVQTVPGFEVVGHALDESRAAELCDQLQPEIVLIGLDEQRSIRAAVAEVRRTRPNIKVLVVAAAAVDDAQTEGADVVLRRPVGTDTFSTTLLELAEETRRPS